LAVSVSWISGIYSKGVARDKNEVNAAFEILLEEIESVADALNEAEAEAFRSGDYEKAHQAIELATRLDEFRGKVKALQREWVGFSARDLKPQHRGAARKRKGRPPPRPAHARGGLSQADPGGSDRTGRCGSRW